MTRTYIATVCIGIAFNEHLAHYFHFSAGSVEIVALSVFLCPLIWLLSDKFLDDRYINLRGDSAAARSAKSLLMVSVSLLVAALVWRHPSAWLFHKLLPAYSLGKAEARLTVVQALLAVLVAPGLLAAIVPVKTLSDTHLLARQFLGALRISRLVSCKSGEAHPAKRLNDLRHVILFADSKGIHYLLSKYSSDATFEPFSETKVCADADAVLQCIKNKHLTRADMRKNMGGFTDSAELLVEYSRLYRYYVLGVVSDPCEFWQNLKFTACGSTSVEDSSGM